MQRLKASFEAKGIVIKHGFYSWLAEKYDVSKQTPNDWFNPDKGYPKLETLSQIANDLDVSLDFLLYGVQNQGVKFIPLYSMNNAVRYLQGEEVEAIESLPSIFPLTDGFATILQDTSMKDETNNFNQNTIVVLDKTRIDVENGDLVFAVVNNYYGVFSQYLNYGGNESLTPFNKEYKTISENFKIVASFAYAIYKNQKR